MSSVTILGGQAYTEHAAKSELLEKIKSYIKSGWHIQGGISHAIMQQSSENHKTTHFFSVLMVKQQFNTQ